MDDGALLRGAIDALQIEVNQIKGELLDSQNPKVSTELSITDVTTQMESFQSWTLKEVLRARNRSLELTGHVKVALDEVKAQVSQAACPCTPATCDRCPKDKLVPGGNKEQVLDPWMNFLAKTEKEKPGNGG